MKVLVSLASVLLLCSISCSSDDTVEDPLPAGEPGVDNPYFPPTGSNDWETVSINSLEWSTDAEQPLLNFLEENDTEAFLLLKDGRIVIEAYFNDANMTTNNPWNSVGKTLSAFVVGVAEQEGYLSLNNPSSDYLGTGWSLLTPSQEANIKVKHHLTMTTGLDYQVANLNCTDADCLRYLNEPGSYWYYHNAPYTLNHTLVSGAIDGEYDAYFNNKLKEPIGMDGAWVQLGYARIYYSTARSMARFGLLNLYRGKWNNDQILEEGYFDEMTNTSQGMNQSYGYLWWLNGKESFRSPGSELQFPGKLIPNAPDDLIAGLGKDDQKLYVVPSEGMVLVRMGNDTGESLLGPSSFDNELWEKINALINR